MKITPSYGINVLVICGLCEQPTPLTYKLEKNGKILCLCRSCIYDLTKEIINRYKKNQEKQ